MTSCSKIFRVEGFHRTIIYDPQLKKPIKIICSCPDTLLLVQKVLREGDLVVKVQQLRRAGKCWPGLRIIALSQLEIQNETMDVSKQIKVLLFELCNMLRAEKIQKYFSLAEKGQITKDSCVRKVEKIEHASGLKIEFYLNQLQWDYFGLQKVEWHNFQDFELHYKYQQLTGHSQQIAAKYDLLSPSQKSSPYKGTWGGHLTDQEKKRMYWYCDKLWTALHGEASESKTAKKRLGQAIVRLGSSMAHRKAARREALLIQQLMTKEQMKEYSTLYLRSLKSMQRNSRSSVQESKVSKTRKSNRIQ